MLEAHRLALGRASGFLRLHVLGRASPPLSRRNGILYPLLKLSPPTVSAALTAIEMVP